MSAVMFRVRTCPILSDCFSDLFLSPPRPRDVFKPRSKDHKVTGLKTRVGDMIFIDFPVPGVVRPKI